MKTFFKCQVSRFVSDESECRLQGLVKGAELCLNPYFFGWCGEENWLAVEVLSPCQK